MQSFLPSSLLVAFFLLVSSSQADIDVNEPGKLPGRLAFTKITNEKKDLVVADLDSGRIKTLFASDGDDQYPDWSPDGKTIVFHSDFCGDFDIFSIAEDGSELKRLTRAIGDDLDPDWSHDGKKIVFRSEREFSDEFQIYQMDPNGDQVIKLTNSEKKNAFPKWSPNGSEILFATNRDWPGWDLVVLDLKTNAMLQLTNGSRSYLRANWRPDGKSFAFSFGSANDAEIFLLEKGNSTGEPLVQAEGRSFDPFFSDTGKLLFYSSELDNGFKNYQIFVKNTETGNSLQLTDGDSYARHPSWTSLPEYIEVKKPSKLDNRGKPSAALKLEICQ